MTFKTETGSTYEVEGCRIRRIQGTHSPTQRQGADLSWKNFVSVSPIEVGHSVVVVWRWTLRDSGKLTAQATQTSRVVKILE